MGIVISTVILACPFILGFMLGQNWKEFPGDKKNMATNTEEQEISIRKIILVR